MQATEQFATVAEYNARIDELATKREQSSGSAKGQLTKVIRALEQSRDELYAKQCRDENVPPELQDGNGDEAEPEGPQDAGEENSPASQSPQIPDDEPVDVDKAVAEFHEQRQKLVADLREQNAGPIADIIEAGEKVKLVELEEAVAQTLNGIWNEGGLEDGPGETDVASIGDYVVGQGLLAFYSAAKFGNGEWASKAVVKRVTKRFDELHAQQPVAA